MERGEIGLEDGPATVFIFEGLVARCSRPRTESALLSLRRWEAAFDCWVFDIGVCDHIAALVDRFSVPVDIVTWHGPAFANLVHDRLWSMGARVRETRSEHSYTYTSQHAATDGSINQVYDADPLHRYGYGFKARQFTIGRF